MPQFYSVASRCASPGQFSYLAPCFRDYHHFLSFSCACFTNSRSHAWKEWIGTTRCPSNSTIRRASILFTRLRSHPTFYQTTEGYSRLVSSIRGLGSSRAVSFLGVDGPESRVRPPKLDLEARARPRSLLLVVSWASGRWAKSERSLFRATPQFACYAGQRKWRQSDGELLRRPETYLFDEGLIIGPREAPRVSDPLFRNRIQSRLHLQRWPF